MNVYEKKTSAENQRKVYHQIFARAEKSIRFYNSTA